jgi:hypothetical protein
MKLMRALVCIVAVALAAAVTVSAQGKPDFSGKWTLVSPADSAGQVLVVKQDARTLSSVHPSEGDDHNIVFNLDGSERRNALSSHGAEIVAMAKAVWNGNDLVITEAVTYPAGNRADTKQIWSLDATGRLLIDHTYTSAGKAPVNVKLIYKK